MLLLLALRTLRYGSSALVRANMKEFEHETKNMLS